VFGPGLANPLIRSLPLQEVAEGHRAMDERRATKAVLTA
jgi:hypothetical protein